MYHLPQGLAHGEPLIQASGDDSITTTSTSWLRSVCPSPTVLAPCEATSRSGREPMSLDSVQTVLSLRALQPPQLHDLGKLLTVLSASPQKPAGRAHQQSPPANSGLGLGPGVAQHFVRLAVLSDTVPSASDIPLSLVLPLYPHSSCSSCGSRRWLCFLPAPQCSSRDRPAPVPLPS